MANKSYPAQGYPLAAPVSDNGRLIMALTLVLVLMLASALRVQPLLGNFESQRNGLGPFGDSWAYHVVGYNLAQGMGFSTTDFGGAKAIAENPMDPELYSPAATEAPLYPFVLAGLYMGWGLTGELQPEQMRWTLHWVRVMQCLLDTLTCLLIFLLGRSLLPDRPSAGLLGAAIYAASPYHVYYTSAILTEILACFLAVLAVLLTTRAIKAGRVLVSVFAGIAWGLLSLCRPEYLGLTLGVVVLLAAVEWRRKAEISLVLAMVVGIVMTVSPWMLRNQLTFGSPFISTGSLGYNLFLGTFEGKYPQQGWNNLPKEVFENDSAHAEAEALVADVVSALRSGGMEVVEVDRNFMSLALDRFRTDPAGVITSWALNLPRLFYQNGGQLYRDPEPGGNYALEFSSWPFSVP